MRRAFLMSLIIMAQFGWVAGAHGQMPPALATQPLALIPTALEELKELRINTGKKAVLRDGTYSAVYVKDVPSSGSTYLNFHVDVSSETGPFVLRSNEIRLESGSAGATVPRFTFPSGIRPRESSPTRSYTPFDWFLDTGMAEVRGDSLTVDNKAIVQFTIEVPEAGHDDLTLFMRSQRIGTVREIREQIARNR